MSKAERYIELVSDENGNLCDQHALRAVEIAREEIIEWIEENIGEYCDGEHIMFSAIHIENIDVFEQERFINDLKQAMKDE